ncbi:MAG TPA: SpoIIE family protein phosphatase [Candidatus Polarisedimenticolaceae bacterium]|nr:SpoIIE family protein phosphatase [Candidatus Polarisedimenticolaceae bacterium]
MKRLRLLLGPLFLFAAAYQLRTTVDVVRLLADPAARVRPPFYTRTVEDTIVELEPEAKQAGIAVGDRLRAVGGRPYTGIATISEALAARRPGETLEVVVRNGESVEIVLAPAVVEQHPSFLIVWMIAMPWLCLLLGFWVALLRPADPAAWILLLLLVSFGLIPGDRPTGWSGWMRPAGGFWHLGLGACWGIAMLLFALRFPERFPFDRERPRLKWLLVGPLVAFYLLNALATVAVIEDFHALSGLYALIRRLDRPATILTMCAIGGFFAAMGAKLGMARRPDEFRRLVFPTYGAAIGLFPTFVLALRSLIFHVGFVQDVPPWIQVPALLMMCLFPASLAYAIIVERAMDVRVVIRQGLQYALARRGVRLLRVLAILGTVGIMYWLLSKPGARRPMILTTLAAGIWLTVMMEQVTERLRRWIDRRFFREAFDAERILGELSEKVRTMVLAGPLLETLGRTIAESLHVTRIAVMVEAPGGYVPAYASGYAQAPDVRFDSSGPTVAKLRESGEPLRVARNPIPSAAERAMLDTLEAELLLPLAAKQKLPGFLCLAMKRSEEPYSGSEIRLLHSVATQAGLALENSRLTEAIASEVAQRERMNREVEIAREVQQRLFPQRLPVVPGLDYSGSCRPALAVGGDYFDFLELPGGLLGIAVADVSGKGIGAALLMASLQASLRGQTIQRAGELSAVIGRVNRLVYDATPDNRYATFYYGQYDPASRELIYVNAGHCPPMVLRRRADGSREVLRLKTGGTVVGLFAESTYAEGTIRLEPGDVVIAYTDGFSEAMNRDDEEWGDKNIEAAATDCDGLDARVTIDRILAAADAFTAGAPQHDDMTLVVLRVE